MKLFFLNKNTIKFIFCMGFWISIILSIGSPFIVFENHPIKLTNARSLAPFFFLLIALIFFYKQIYLNLNKNITIKLFFWLHFFYLLGQFLHFEQLIKPETALIFYSLSTFVLFLITKDLEKNLRYYLGTLLAVMTIIYLIYSYLIIRDFFNHNYYWLYSYKLNETFLNAATPRITGTARSLSIIFLALSIFFIKFNLKNIYSFFILISSLIIFILIWGLQSRGAFLCLSLTLLLLLFIYYKTKLKKCLIIIFVMAFAVYAYDGFSKKKVFFSKNINPNQNYNNPNQNYNNPNQNYNNPNQNYNNQNQIPNNDFSKTRVLQKENVSSGRFLIWNSLFHYYEFKNLFGYGIQADRYLLKSYDPTYTNASNGFIYAFICGGYFSFFILLIIFLVNVKYIFDYYFKNIIKNTYDYIGLLSFFILIFFSTRIFFENSFSLFGLDFILYLLSSLILKKKLTN